MISPIGIPFGKSPPKPLVRTFWPGIARLFDRLRASRSTASRSWQRAQNGLVALQVAIALVLLIATGLLGRSFWNLNRAKIGFEPEDAMTFQVSRPWNGYTNYTEGAAFHARVVDRLAALPGVTSVAVAQRLPLAGHGARLAVQFRLSLVPPYRDPARTLRLSSVLGV